MPPRAAITAIFFLNGAAVTGLFARLPAIQERLALSDGELGIALLGAPLGLLVAQPVAGAVAARSGSRAVLAVLPPAFAVLALPAIAPNLALLVVCVAAVGAMNGALDIAMNAQGLAVERASGVRLFTSLHAAFSFGALAGAALAAAVAAAGIAPAPHLAALAVAAAAVLWWLNGSLLPTGSDAAPGGARFARPSRRLAAFAGLAFCVLLAEGSMFDWSAVYFAGELGTGEGVAALALAAFNLAMGVGRLAGDRLADLLGDAVLARSGTLLAAAGLGLAVAAPGPALALPGLAAMGLGLASAFPIALRAAARASDSPAPAVAAVSTFGYAGFLTGPPVIGALSEAAGGLRPALGFVVVLCLVGAGLSGRLAGA